jgi:hypothetical protein
MSRNRRPKLAKSKKKIKETGKRIFEGGCLTCEEKKYGKFYKQNRNQD